MKGFYVHGTTDFRRSRIIDEGRISPHGRDHPTPRSRELEMFRDVPTVAASYFCEGYPRAYLSQGFIFLPKTEPVGAVPVDINMFLTGHPMRFHPGTERYVFSTVDDMLDAFPHSRCFADDYRDFLGGDDYLFFDQQRHRTYNEVRFRAPLEVEVVGTFDSRAELAEMFGRL
jgi:hypothetical protein